MTHVGSQMRERNPVYSTRPLATALSILIDRPVRFIPHAVGGGAEAAVGMLKDGDVAILENLIFHRGETENSRSFAIRLSILGDVLVNDAPEATRLGYASTHALGEFLPAYAGPLLHDAIASRRTMAATVSGPNSNQFEKV
jgi:phosphoglycerate kinase